MFMSFWHRYWVDELNLQRPMLESISFPRLGHQVESLEATPLRWSS